MEMIVGMCRYLLPFLAFVILFKCFRTLLIGHPVNKTYGYIQNSKSGERLELNTWETSIGRSKSCDIVLTSASVSRFHAVICRRVDGWYLFDTVSKMGTFLNGKKIESGETIKNGDEITFGDSKFVFVIIDDPVIKVGKKRRGKGAADPEMNPDGIPEQNGAVGSDMGYAQGVPNKADPLDLNGEFNIDINKPKTSAAGNRTQTPKNTYSGTAKTAQPTVRVANKAPKRAVLLNSATRERFVLCSSQITIGRGRNNDIKLTSPAVSRNHAVMTLLKGRWYITDSGSTHGTVVSGKKIKSTTLLHSGDIIVFGDEQLRFVDDNR